MVPRVVVILVDCLEPDPSGSLSYGAYTGDDSVCIPSRQ